MNNFQWVALATNPKDPRDFMRYIHIFDGMMYATDGLRMHRAPVPEGIEPGIYDHNGENVGTEFAVFRNIYRPFAFEFNAEAVDIVDMFNLNGLFSSVGGIHVHPSQLWEALDGASGVEYSTRADNSAIRGKYDEREFIIMGVTNL